jgi:UDP-glucose 4-epimerase
MTATSLITDGAGFMGSRVVRACLDRGDTVVALDDLSGGLRENVPADASFIEGSISDVKLINDLSQKHCFD